MTENAPNKLDAYFSQVPMSETVNKDNIDNVRDWIKTQPHLPAVSDRQISIFLHSCYGDIEMTKTTVENYYTKRTEMCDVFSNRRVDELKANLHVIYIFKSSSLSVDKYQIMHIGFLDKDSNKFDNLSNVKTFFALLDLHTNLTPYASGWRLCLDAKCLSFRHYVKLTTSLRLACKTIYYLQAAVPIRLKGIHVRNANSLISQFLNLLKPFMKKELFELIHLHPASDNTLFDYIPKESIPHQDYDNPIESSEKFLKDSLATLDQYREWFDDDERLARVDESKRITCPKVDKRPSFFRSFMGVKSEKH